MKSDCMNGLYLYCRTDKMVNVVQALLETKPLYKKVQSNPIKCAVLNCPRTDRDKQFLFDLHVLQRKCSKKRSAYTLFFILNDLHFC